MNRTSRTITGIALILIGLILIGVSFLTHFITLFYGPIILIVGFFILFNRKEDKIEERKDIKNRRAKN